ncbi:hypothetical protein OBBRIDRAFT_875289 [Obba rivulosa]|uniref:ferric-chelate reductase (NADPH) n=1 Tax=Obba rivulosa TaxID=1052685 RepID=A0A8E2AV95_9APHY|nr:hypothetical protein OBBRIDRAFT_875289 [Obba rivulosa]
MTSPRASNTATIVPRALSAGFLEDLYAKELWYLVGSVIGVAVAIHGSSIVWAWHARRSSRRQDESRSPQAREAAVSLWHLPGAILTASRIGALRWRIPFTELTVLEALLTAIYLAAILVWEFANTQDLQPKQWANRAGHLAAIQMPLLVALSSKNSVITVITGIGHEKLNIMHRILSRCILILTWVHLWGRYVVPAFSQRPVGMLNQPWKRVGLAAGIAQSLLTFISIKPLRALCYEFFVATHIILVLVFLVALQYHCYMPGFAYYIWPCWIIWSIDRFGRYGRILLFNFVLRVKDPKARVEPLGGDTTRVTLRRRVLGGWTAGQHVFLAFPTLGPGQSHPFTIANVAPESGSKEAEMVFVIRACNGLTRQLLERAEKDGKCELPVTIDGPYGCPPDLSAFETCIFVAGGSGISFVLPRMTDLFRAVSVGKARARRVVFVWAIRSESHIEWVAPELAYAFASAPPGVSFFASAFITSGNAASMQVLTKTATLDADVPSPLESASITTEARGGPCDASSPPSEKFPEGEKTPTGMATPASVDSDLEAGKHELADAWMLSTLARRTGRPDLRAILKAEVGVAEGPVSVDVSGPDPLVNGVRDALSSGFAGPLAVLRGAPTVQLNVEQFRM